MDVSNLFPEKSQYNSFQLLVDAEIGAGDNQEDSKEVAEIEGTIDSNLTSVHPLYRFVFGYLEVTLNHLTH